MRYYSLSATLPGVPVPIQTWTSHPLGPTFPPDPGALNVTFDILAYNYSSPMGASTVTIEGPALKDLYSLSKYQDLILTVRGGMGKGLPLADPKQIGVLTTASVWQLFSNWQGTDMDLDFVLLASPYTDEIPGNFSFNWPAHTPLAPALKTTLQQLYPGFTIAVNISPNLVLPNTETHAVGTLEQFSQYIQDLTKSILGGTYQGVQITIIGSTVYCHDYTLALTPIQLKFTDFVGQPTWIEPYVIQVKLIMRGDIQVGSYVTFPSGLQDVPGITLTTAASLPSYTKYQSVFKGSFYVTSVRHVGNYKSADGASWVTILNCIAPGQVALP